MADETVRSLPSDLPEKKIKWVFHVSNEKVLRRVGIKSIETFVGSARLRWYGDVVRMPETRFLNFLLD